MQLKDKVAVVTGGASGFGKAIARLYAQEGARVVVADLNGPGADAVAADIGSNAVACQADVANRDDVEKMAKAAADNFGGIDILVNNAGYTHQRQWMLNVDEATFDRVFAVNVKAIYLAAIVFVPLLEARGGGVIINTASTAGLRPRPGLTWYNGSKGAAVILTKSMAVELAPKKIRVNALCPVIGETGLLEDFMGVPDTPENRAQFIATIPLGRMSQPKDIAAAALYLASDAAEFITGVALEIDGGRCV